MEKIVDMLKTLIVKAFGGLGRKCCIKMQHSYAKMRQDAKTSDFAVSDGDITPVRAIKQLQLMLFKAAIISLTLLAQPLLRMIGTRFMQNDDGLNLLAKTGLMAMLTALYIMLPLVLPTQVIPDDDGYKRFMKTLWHTFLGVSVALPSLDWLVTYSPLSGRLENATATLMAISGIALLFAIVAIFLLYAANAFCQLGWFIGRSFVRESDPAKSTALEVIPEETRETSGGRLSDK